MNETESFQPKGACPDAAFGDLGLSDALMSAVSALGYVSPTPVQAQAIPEVLAGRDLLAAAQTGTGKTAAFLFPTMNSLPHVERSRKNKKGCGPLMLVVTPTRELAQQIEDVCRTVAEFTKHTSVTVVGGLSYNPQINALRRGCDILIATPGRLIDLMNQGACNLDQVKVLVLDEADRMLDMGFLPDVRRIVQAVPEERQTLLFSATLDDSVVGSIADLVKDPARVEIAPATKTADTVAQYVLPVSLEAKNALLASVLKKEGSQRVIVFTRTKHRADACRRRLERAGIPCETIHGDRSQNQRSRALEAFREGSVDVLVATDVLSRGIDVSGVRYVVNFDVPEEPADYIHRIGRTGRAGDVGWSLTFVTEQDVAEFFDIETLIGKTADLYDAEGLDVGERPVAIDPERVPGTHMPSKRAKSRRNRAKRAIERKAAQSPKKGSGSRKPARPATSGETTRPATEAAQPAQSGEAKRLAQESVAQPKGGAAAKPAKKQAARKSAAKPRKKAAQGGSPVAARPPRKKKMVDPEVAKVEAELRRKEKSKANAKAGSKKHRGRPSGKKQAHSGRAAQPSDAKRSRKGSPSGRRHEPSRTSGPKIRTRNRAKGARGYK